MGIRPPASLAAESLRWHRTPISPVNRSAAAVPPSSRPEPAAAAPVRDMAREGDAAIAEKRNDDRLEALLPGLPDVARALIRCDGANHRCSLPICAVCARDYRQGPIAQLHALAQAYAGPHEVATIYLDLFPPALWRTRTSDAPAKCSANVWTARASRARLWWAGSRLLGRRTGSAGSCTPKCSPSASTRTPGSSSKPP